MKNITVENIFLSESSRLNMSKINLNKVSSYRCYLARIIPMNGFNFLVDSIVNIGHIYASYCKFADYFILASIAKISVENGSMSNNEFSTLMKATTETFVTLKHTKSFNNNETRQTKFIIAERGSNLKFFNITSVTSELSRKEHLIQVIDSNITFEAVYFNVINSNSLIFDILKGDKHVEYHLNHSKFICPNNYNALTSTSYPFRIFCQKCEKNTYPTNTIGRKLSLTTSHTTLEKTKSKSLKCQNCPTGAICIDGGIKARDNFHGFLNRQKEYDFVLCPDDYCCSTQSKECTSPTTCSFNRTGPLCGQCIYY